MDQELISAKFEKVVQAKTYTSIVLSADNKKFAIYTDPPSGKYLQLFLTDTKKSRPPTLELMNMIFFGLEIKLRQVVIKDLSDTVYLCRAFFEQQRGDILHIVEIDCRPSDSITLAVLNKAPLYCTTDLLSKVVPFLDD